MTHLIVLVRVKIEMVYEIPCHGCDQVYVGETGRTMEKHTSECKQAVRKFDDKNRTAFHVVQNDHQIGRMPGSSPQTSGGKA